MVSPTEWFSELTDVAIEVACKYEYSLLNSDSSECLWVFDKLWLEVYKKEKRTKWVFICTSNILILLELLHTLAMIRSTDYALKSYVCTHSRPKNI